MDNYSIFIPFTWEEVIFSQNIIFSMGLYYNLYNEYTVFSMHQHFLWIFIVSSFGAKDTCLYMPGYGMQKLATPQPTSKTWTTPMNVDKLSHIVFLFLNLLFFFLFFLRKYFLTWIYNKFKWSLKSYIANI